MNEERGDDGRSAATTRESLGDWFVQVPVAMLVVDTNGRIVASNHEAEALLGYSRSELEGELVELVVPQRSRDAHPGFRSRFFAAPSARPMGEGRELFALRKDGREFPVEIGLRPIVNKTGETFVLTAIVDLSRIQRLERRFERVVEYAPNAMVKVDPNGRIAMVNAAAEELFGYKREEMLGREVEMLVPERLRAQHPAFRDMYLSSPAARPMGVGRDLRAVRKDRSEFPVEIGLNPIETDEGTMVLSVIVDISERKHREERIASALLEKDILLGEIHHRVKNNLQIVDSLLDLQAMRIADRNVREMLRESRDRVRSMSLIHQTLYRSGDFARVDFQIFLENLLPPLIAAYAMEPARIRVRPDVEAVRLPIEIALPCGLIVNELVTNALKHGFPVGTGGDVWITLQRASEKEAVLAVGNDGKPIPEDFDLELAGGLGMQLVTLLARQIRGRIEVERAHPTVFRLQFPI